MPAPSSAADDPPYPSRKELETALAEAEERLPRLGETWTVVSTPAYDDDGEDWGGKEVCSTKNPPEAEINRRFGCSPTWKDEHGREWWYHDSGVWVSQINLLAWVRAIRDELSDRLGRAYDHLQVGYDS